MTVLSGFTRRFQGFGTTLSARLRGWVPYPLLPSDVFLVSFPKSGNTWLRFLLANAMVRHLGLDVDMDFAAVHSIIPDIHRDSIAKEPQFSPFPRIIKSHVSLNRRYPRVIYLVRDGRDVMISFLGHLKREQWFGDETSISEILRNKRFGIRPWRDHVRSWFAMEGQENFHWLRYEDLLADTAGRLKECLDFIGIEMADETVSFAVSRSSFKSMRRVEETKGLKFGRSMPGARFIRKGQSGEWFDALSAEDRSYSWDEASETFERLGYQFDQTTDSR